MPVVFSFTISTISLINDLLVGYLSNTFRYGKLCALLLNMSMSKGLWYGFGRETL